MTFTVPKAFPENELEATLSLENIQDKLSNGV